MVLLRLLLLSAGLLAMPAWGLDFTGVDLAGKPCHGGSQGYGPFDYTNPADVRDKLPIVEHYHFTPEVERLIRGHSGYLLGDLDYTLRAFPNHHRALFALIRYATEPGRQRSGHGKITTPPECYLQRALRFQPKDGNLYLLYGLYLHRLKHYPEAETRYRKAVDMMPDNAETHYNLAVLLTDLQRYPEAVAEARTAYRLGYPLSGLKHRLADAGHPLTAGR